MSVKTLFFCRRACSWVFVALIAIASPATAQQELQLVFGLYTTDKPTVMVRTFRPILSAIEVDLSEALGIPVRIRTHISPSYESGVAALVNGDVDFARFGPASYIVASQQNSQLRILALDSKNADQTTKGVICVREDSGITKITDLYGARFAFGNEESTIGRYLSQAYLLNNGISVWELEYFDYLDRHDRVGYAVANGSFDAGALKESTFDKLKAKGLPLRALAKFDNVNKPWIASAGMNDQLFETLRRVMFELSAPEAFKTMGRKQFVAGSDEDFQDIRDAIANNAKFFIKAAPVSSAANDAE